MQQKQMVGHIAKDLLRVGIWRITRNDKPIIEGRAGELPYRVYLYGSGENSGQVIITGGELSVADRGVFLLIQQLEEKQGGKFCEGHISDLVKLKLVKNPYQTGTINAIRQSIENLLDISIRIRPKNKGFSAGFKLVSGCINSDDTFILSTKEYRRVLQNFQFFEMKITLNDYFKVKSPVELNLKMFLMTQNIPFVNQGCYQISLLKLCKYIGYEPKLPIKKIWQTINKALLKLKEENFISFKRDKKRQIEEGGTIIFWRPKKTPEKSIIKNNPDYIDRIIDTFAQVHGDYYVLNKGKERKAAGKLLNFFKQIYPDDDKEKILDHLRAFFKKCMSIEDSWYRNNISIPLIVSKYNEINQILKYGPNGYIKNENSLNFETKVIAGKTCEWDKIERKWCFAEYGRWWWWNEEKQAFYADKYTRWRD